MNSTTIPAEFPQEPAQNFQILRDEALALIARLSGEQWTDHNLHDPGITLMEAACFAITDLGYRQGFPMADLMAQPDSETPRLMHWQPDQALACQPLTENDYRRLFLDIDGVRNVSVQQNLADAPGLWNIQVVPAAGAPEDLAEQVQDCYLRHRNLGEDLGQCLVLPEQSLTLRLELTLRDGADTAETLADLLWSFGQMISPPVPFASYAEQRSEGFSNEALATGPWLSHGYVSDASLARPVLASHLFLTRLVESADAHPGVVSIEQLQMSAADNPLENSWESWALPLSQQAAPILNTANSLPYIRVVKEGVSVSVPTERITSLLAQRQEQIHSPERAYSQTTPGRYRQLADYLSLQYELPVAYGTGRHGLAPDETPERVASVRQLQAYLLLYDQLLANQFAQLDGARHLLSLPDRQQVEPLLGIMEKMLGSQNLSDNDIARFWAVVADQPLSHRSQPVDGLHQLPVLMADQLDDYRSPTFEHLTEKPFSEDGLERWSRALEHQLARFHEQVPDRAMLKYEELFRHYVGTLLCHPDADPELDEASLTARLARLKSLLDQALFLLDIPRTGADRGLGGNYHATPVRSAESFSGLRHRLYRRLGLPRVAMDSLGTHNIEGFYLVEGQLLRHGDNVVSAPHEVFLVAPDWPSRFANPEFARLVATTFARELPVHLKPRVLWLGRRAMLDFEQVHHAWLHALSLMPLSDSEEHATRRQDRLRLLSGYLDRFLSDRQSLPLDSSEWQSILQPTLEQHDSDDDSRDITIQNFTVGYQPIPDLEYNPDDPAEQSVIEHIGIDPDPDAAEPPPFVVRIRTPYKTSDQE